jgi:cyclase
MKEGSLAKELEILEVAPNVYACLGPNGSANSGFVVGNDRVALIDAQASPSLGRSMRRAIKAATTLPVTHVFVTHHHGDHLFGLGAWPEARWLCHKRCREILTKIATDEGISEDDILTPSAALKIFVGDRSASILSRDPNNPLLLRLNSPEFKEARLLIPDAIPDDELKDFRLDLGGISLKIQFLGVGHGDDDITVWVPEHDAVFLGDLAYIGRIPAVTSLYINEWIELLERLLEAKISVVVPGHGPPCPPSGLHDQIIYLKALRRVVKGDTDVEKEIERFHSLPRFETWHSLNIQVLKKGVESTD